MYVQDMLVPHITHAYIVSRQKKRQASKQASEQSSGARQAGVRLAYSARGYHARRSHGS